MDIMTAALIAIFLALQGADIMTTTQVLEAGGRELNAIVRWFMSKMDRGWWIVKLAIAIIAIVPIVVFVPGWTRVGILGAFCVGMVVVVIRNHKVLRGMNHGRRSV